MNYPPNPPASTGPAPAVGPPGPAAPGAPEADLLALAIALSHRLPLTPLPPHLLTLTARLVQAEAVALWLAQTEQRCLDLLGSLGLASQPLTALRRPAYADPVLVSRTAHRATPHQVPDLDQAADLADPDRAMAWSRGLSSLLAVPLLTPGEVVGVLLWGARRPWHFGPAVFRRAQAVAALWAGTLAREVLRRQGQQQARHLRLLSEVAELLTATADSEQLVARVCDRVAAVLGELCGLGLCEPGTDRLRLLGLSARSPDLAARARAALAAQPPRLGVGLLGQVAATGHPLLIADLRREPLPLALRSSLESLGLTSTLAVPLRVQGKVIGVLSIGTVSPDRRLTPADLATAQTLAVLSAQALESARLYAAVTRERQRLTVVLDRAPFGVVIAAAPDGRIVLVNRPVVALVGRPPQPDERVTDHLSACAIFTPHRRPLPPAAWPLYRVLAGRPEARAELVVRCPDGEERVLLDQTIALPGSADSERLAVTFLTDITAVRRAERLREEFIAIIAHDLRAPVTVIQGYASLLRTWVERLQAPETVRRAVEHVHTSAQRLGRMISDLLDASRIEARRLRLELQRFDLVPYLRELLARLRPALEPHPVRLEIRAPSLPVLADPLRVEQVLTNLLSNAAKYSPPTAEITVEARQEDMMAYVAVTDRGPGIPPEELPYIFERFVRGRRRPAEGLGLGLYIARGLVEAMGGRIGADSRPGQGTTIFFTLPLAGWGP